MILRNCDSKEFIKRLHGRKVICFGAGAILKEAAYEVNRIEELENHIAFFVDNNESKQGLKYTYKDKEFDIKGIEIFETIDSNDYVLLITCTYYVEIYEQLKEMSSIKDMECYMYYCVCNNPNLDINNFFINEIAKDSFKNWKTILHKLNLKDKHKGERCFIIGNGPSLTASDLELLKNETTFAANRIYKIFKETSWRPTYFFCVDFLVYVVDHNEMKNVEADFRFIPLERSLAAGKIYSENIYYNRTKQNGMRNDNRYLDATELEFSEDAEEKIYAAETVVYDMLQFAVYMGFSEIYLIGMDHMFKKEVLQDGTVIEHDVKGNHFCKEYDEGLDNAVAIVAPLYATEGAFKKAREVCDCKGILIRNATRGGYLEVFERVTLEEALK